MKEIAIIGFGFCGRATFFHLTKTPNTNSKITIFEKDGVEALGPAFSKFSPHYVLNVPVSKMSAFSNKPKDFSNFLAKKYPEILEKIGEEGFAPRYIYGEYLDELTKKAFENAKKNGVNFEFVKQKILSIDEGSQGSFLITDESKKTWQADEIFLATSFVQSEFPFETKSEKSVKKLWSSEIPKFHQQDFSDKKICLIGSGLTAVDVIIGLKKRNFGGKIFVISRRGNLPKKHLSNLATTCPTFITTKDAKDGVVFICQKIRKFLQQNPQFEIRHVIDSIRSITVKIWQAFDEKNKKKFLRLMPYWSVFRHRAPVESIDAINEMILSNQLELKNGGVKKITEKDGKFFVQTKDEELESDYLVNCLGFEFSAKKYPLMKQMIEAGLLKEDLLLAKSNNKKIHLLGALNIGRDFECTSVPDLRVNVENEIKKCHLEQSGSKF